MRFKLFRFVPLLAVFCVGCVICKTPVGDKVARLNPQEWNGKWVGGDGGIIWTKIKDAKLGIVELTAGQPFPKPRLTEEILVRNLGPLLIGNQKAVGDQKADNGYKFGRISIDATHFVIFDANESVFSNLVRRHELAGKLDRDKNGKPTGNGGCILERFSDKEYRRLKEQGFDLRSLFNEDPDTVLVRYKWRLF